MSRHTSLRSALLLAVAAALPGAAVANDLSWSALGGYQQGAALRVTGTLTRLTPDLPLGIQFGAGYRLVDPGRAEAARRVFINDATNGTPEESGHVWDLRADLVWFTRSSGALDQVGFFAGPRYSWFTGRFRFVGGNEDFLVESNAWGIGLGVRGELRLNPRWSLAGAIGVDWFPRTSIYSHDASYSSTGYKVNAREIGNTGTTYGWSDADKAVNQPKIVPSVLIGAAWRP